MPESVDPVRALFDAVIGLDAGTRRAMLDARRAAEPDIVGEVETLLSFCDLPGLLDESPVAIGERLEAEIGPSEEHAAQIAPGTRVGGYTILRPIGMGGMGVVYEADQDMPRRRVALKLVRTSTASRALARRFEHEATALALLQHPGIAQIYQAGVAQIDGEARTFIAMELVVGLPITRHAKTANLSLRDTLDLVARVCDAVQHAHQRGVIHRDLKPGNILVTSTGDPKVLDFGIARLTGEHLAITLSTSAGQIVGTLGYMSPEQALGETSRIDTRTDVYALGVILYELICGRRPIGDGASTVTAALHALDRESPKPPSSIVPECRGDIDVIVLRALEKQPERRYQSPGALAEDIRRHLLGQAIEARRDSAAYVLSRQLRRYRGLVIAGAVAFLAVGVFAVAAWRQSVKSRELAVRLEQELSISRVERGRLQLAAGQPIAAELALWTEWLPRHGQRSSQWALREVAARTGLGAAWSRLSPGFTAIVTHQAGTHASGTSTPAYSIVAERIGVIHRFDPDASLSGPRWSTTLERAPSGMAISGDGRVLLCIVDGNPVLIAPETGAVQSTLPVRIQPPRSGRSEVAISPSGDRMYAWASRDEIAAWSLPDGRELARASVPAGRVQVLALSPDGTILAAINADAQADILDAQSLRPKAQIACPDGDRGATFTADGTSLVIGGTKSAAIIDASTWTTTRTIDLPSQTLAAYPMDAHRVLIVGAAGPATVHVEKGVEWTEQYRETTNLSIAPGPIPGSLIGAPDLRSLRLIWPDGCDAVTPIGQLARSALIRTAVSTDDRLLATWGGAGVSIFRTDGSDAGGPGRSLPRNATGTRWCEFSPDGSLLGVLSEGRTLVLYSTQDWSVRGEIRPRGLATSFIFSPDNSRVVVGGAEGLLAAFLVPTGEPAELANRGSDAAAPLGFMDDGRTLLASERAERPRAWRLLHVDAKTMQIRARIEQDPGTIRGVLDQIGHRLITVEGQRLRVLTLPDAREQAMYTGVGTQLRALDVGSAGRTVFACTADGLTVFDVDRAAAVFQAPNSDGDPLVALAALHTREGVALVYRSGRIAMLDFNALDRRLADTAQLMVNQLSERAAHTPDLAAFSEWGARVKQSPTWVLTSPQSQTSQRASTTQEMAEPTPSRPADRENPDSEP